MNYFKLMLNRYKFERAKNRSKAFAQHQLDEMQLPQEGDEVKPKKYPKFGFRM